MISNGFDTAAVRGDDAVLARRRRPPRCHSAPAFGRAILCERGDPRPARRDSDPAGAVPRRGYGTMPSRGAISPLGRLRRESAEHPYNGRSGAGRLRSSVVYHLGGFFDDQGEDAERRLGFARGKQHDLVFSWWRWRDDEAVGLAHRLRHARLHPKDVVLRKVECEQRCTDPGYAPRRSPTSCPLMRAPKGTEPSIAAVTHARSSSSVRPKNGGGSTVEHSPPALI